MLEQREVITLLLAVAVLAFVVRQRAALEPLQHRGILFASLALLLTSLICSVLEGLVWETGINLLQHFFSTLAAIVLAVWCWRTFSPHGAGQ